MTLLANRINRDNSVMPKSQIINDKHARLIDKKPDSLNLQGW